jgi:hypothetical protein
VAVYASATIFVDNQLLRERPVEGRPVKRGCGGRLWPQPNHEGFGNENERRIAARQCGTVQRIQYTRMEAIDKLESRRYAYICYTRLLEES